MHLSLMGEDEVAQVAAECTARLLDVLIQGGVETRHLGTAIREFPKVVEDHIRQAVDSIASRDIGVYAIQDADFALDRFHA